MRLLAPLLLLPLAACAIRTAEALREPGVRAHLSRRLVATLDRQQHYFPTDRERGAFAARLEGIAGAAVDADSYYREVSDALAVLQEGHTGLVGSAEVPFSCTIPPVAILEVDDQPVVAGVAPGVEGGGLRPGDVILAVDGVPAPEAFGRRLAATAGSTPHARRARALFNLLSGPTRVPARVRVRGLDGRERLCFPLRFLLDDAGTDRFRFGFARRRVVARRLSREAGYVALPDFQLQRREEFEQALRPLLDATELVLDLRGNPGGRIRTLQHVAGLFFGRAVVFLRLREPDSDHELRTIPGPFAYRGRLAVLVDERTGSAAELLAAGMQDLGRARVVGRPTAGSARSRLRARRRGGVLFHFAGSSVFRRLAGRRIAAHGVAPDLFYRPERATLARHVYGDPYLDPAVRLSLGRN